MRRSVALRNVSFVVALFALAGCSKKHDATELAEPPQERPFLLFVDRPKVDAGSPFGNGAITVATSPTDKGTEIVLDARAVAHVPVEPNPSGGKIFSANTPVATTLDIPLLPLLADEPLRSLSAGYGNASWNGIRERMQQRWKPDLRIRGRGRDDAVQLFFLEVISTGPALAAMVDEARRSPGKPHADPARAVVYLPDTEEGFPLVLGRTEATLADFDWVARESVVERRFVKQCAYTSKDLPLYAVSTKVVVTTRSGDPIAEKSFDAEPQRAKCVEGFFTMTGTKDRTDAGVHHPNPGTWIESLARKADK